MSPHVVLAQDAPDPGADNTVTISDPVGDVQFTAAPRAAPQHANLSQAGGSYDHLDITRVVWGTETETTFQIIFGIKQLDPTTPMSFPARYVTFSYGRVDWMMSVGGCNRQQQGSAPPQVGCLRFKDSSSRGYRGVVQVPMTRDTATSAFVWTVDKLAVFNENRLPARFGEQFTNLSATTLQWYGGGGPGGGGLPEPTGGAYAGDTAPQGGATFERPFRFVKGSGGHGALGLTSADPIRVTNGEATTIVYNLDLHNTADRAFNVQVDVKGAMEGWSVRAPALMEVGAQSSVAFPVILALPFTHTHGKTALFTVTATALEDPASYAATDLGVFWTDVPQPSGHHAADGMWFHSAPAEGFLPPGTEAAVPLKSYWFNGVEKDPDPDADDANVPAFFNDQFLCMFALPNCKVPPEWRASWFFPLSPELLIGLDFDVAQEGKAKMSFLPKVPDPGARVDVFLQYCDPSKQTGGGQPTFVQGTCYQFGQNIASGTATVALSSNTPANVEVPLKVDPAFDLLPYKRGANIGLAVYVTSTLPQNGIITEPRIEINPKLSHLHLPLLEYHDPIDTLPGGFGLVTISALDPFEKQVNPGRTAVYRFDLTNGDDRRHRFGLEIQGINTQWASFAGPNVLDLAAGVRANFTVAVVAPDDAVDGERAELYAVAQSQDDVGMVALSRIRTTVVTSPDIPDEASLAMSSKGDDSPGPGVVAFALGVLAALAIARRRR